MIEIPDDVEKWTRGKVIDLVDEGYDENDILEFKKEVNSDSERLSKTACAFANTNGGTIIFGIDNDREKALHVDQRVVGLEDSDQLKRNIIDKIKNIQPSIPIKNLIFRKTNIKLPNKRVIVVLKIASSNNKPHQYKHIFYKRLSDGNEPMDVTEVKQLMLESVKQTHHEVLMILELSYVKEALENTKKSFMENKNSLGSLDYLDITSTIHFQHHLAYGYPTDLPVTLIELIHEITRLSNLPNSFASTLNGKPPKFIIDDAKSENFSDPKEFVKGLILTRINTALECLEKISLILERDYVETEFIHPIQNMQDKS
ncbi:hypothetical protein NKOR_03920 [Candidatus Nitrosopumilus koreensis AR1]|uniref:Schlafen AlbA-2 domain-containing protein n=1 Tax=Candidatus Nitrosopumilus koreensis AR1 TaxID=1229908 RepID=K0B5D6_9ARCH|nr:MULTISPECIES: ATP-binding protein [Nitrosopumilus]AFS80674.1 hypothetical protein NKOR_03920 [Candidatus Nitrosopumilus koreensis AR1]